MDQLCKGPLLEKHAQKIFPKEIITRVKKPLN